MDRWTQTKKAGVTGELMEEVRRVMEEVRREWARGHELTDMRIIEPLRHCMDRAREILEGNVTRKTRKLNHDAEQF
ncbi:hypothetical protein GUJ93_ZPchr0010g7746 [Zizania palustris]|uniref:Uncharacterized protein n=1 Tax=Zizania palustris TaxID=103762 RepID=A0A8J6BKY5_ZIZPA|nr:hypothetical protein GUJ93_ZPchr0010g7746 [Zizania palustris]